MDNCVCHLKDSKGNTYVVKDKEARKKIEELQPTGEITQNSEKPVTSGAVYKTLYSIAILLENI